MQTAQRTVTIHLLGPVEARESGRNLDLGGPRQRRLLALLALRAGDRVDTGELIDGVWADGDLPPEPRETLRTYASRLRRSLGDPATIDAKAGAYRLQLDPSAIDCNVFASLIQTASGQTQVTDLTEALALWHGPALAGFEHEDWARPTVARLTEMRHNTNDDLARAYLDRGSIAEAVALLEGIVSGQPLRERSHRLLMQALHSSGRSAEALRVFQTYRHRLATDLGLEPGTDIVSAERAILGGVAVSEPPAQQSHEQVVDSARGYRLLEQIGEGAFAVVYLGTQPTVDRQVAIKVIRTELANRPEFIRRFEAEAHLIARLEHPRIVPLYDYWREPGSAWLVMRYLRGGTLADRISTGPLNLTEVTTMVAQVGDALGAAHRADVIHRDVKPANIFLDGDGNYFLGDFGIAHGLAPSTSGHDAHASGPFGSLAYAATEQLLRLPIGPPADVYGLAITTYECLAGRLPFDHAATATELRRRQLDDPLPRLSLSPLPHHLADDPTRLAHSPNSDTSPSTAFSRTTDSSVDVDVWRRIDEVLATATNKDPTHRHASVAEFVADFRGAVRQPSPTTADRRRGARGDGGNDRNAGTGTSNTPDTGDTTRGRETTSEPLRNPYKGLLAFHEADAADFFGRSNLVERIIERIADTDNSGRFVALVGPSGAGKSSVVQAGLLPRLRRGAVSGSAEWFVTSMLPGAQPFDELEAALVRVSKGPTSGYAELMASTPSGIGRAIKQLLPAVDGDLLLVIDQFEELFTLCHDETIRQRFIAGLVAATLDPHSRVRVVITMRADFYDRPLRYGELATLFERGTITLGPLAADELEQAITAPAARVGATFEPGLVTQIITDVVDQPGALPLLQYALTELFDRHHSGVLTIEAYDGLGRLDGALARRAESLYQASPPEHQQAIRRLFNRLTTPGEGVEDTRRRVLRTELGTSAELDLVVELFGSARLLSFDRDETTRAPTVEVAHEALLRAWPRLRHWLDEDRDGLRLHRHLTMSAAAWEASDRDPGELYRGGRLEALAHWASDHGVDLNDQEAGFVAASTKADAERLAAEHRSRRRLHRLLVGVAVIAVVALLAGGLALQQRSRARDKAAQATATAFAAETDRLAAQAATLATTNLRVALLVAAESYRRNPGPTTLGAIQRVLVRAEGLQRFIGPTEPVESVVWLGSDQFAAARSGAIDVYSDQGILLRSFSGITATKLLVDQPANTLVVGTTQGIRLINLTTAEVSAPLYSGELIQALATGPEGTTLIGTRSGDLIAIDPANGAELFRISAHPEQSIADLGIPGVGVNSVPHLPASAVRGVAAIAVDSSTQTIATVGFGYARMWNVADIGEPRQTVAAPITWTLAGNLLAGGGKTAEFNAGGSELIVADPFQVWVIEVGTGKTLDNERIRERLSFITQGEVTAPLLVDRGRLITAFSGGFVTIADLAGDTPVRQTQHGVGAPTGIAVGADGDRVLVSGSGGINLLSIRGDGPISRVIEGITPADGALSSSGTVIANNQVGTYRAEVWHLTDSGTERVDLQGLVPYYVFFGLKQDAALAIDLDHGVVLFDPRTGGNHRHAEGWDARKGGSPWFSTSTDDLALTSETGRIGIIDSVSGELTDIEPWAPNAPPLLPPLAFDSSGRFVYGVQADGLAMRWELATGKATRLGNVGADVGWIAVSPSGDVVTAHFDGAVIVRDPQTMQPTGERYDATRPGYPGVGFSADGTRLLTFYGREMRIWDVERHEPIGDPLPSDENSLVAASPNGQWGLSTIDGTFVRWNLNDREWPAIACDVAGRTMTAEEWALYGPRDTALATTCAGYSPAGRTPADSLPDSTTGATIGATIVVTTDSSGEALPTSEEERS